MAKTPYALADQFLRDARRETLNKRINYKGNYENYITGGSRALNNQVRTMDTNEYAAAINDPNSGWKDEEWLGELNDRYTNPQHNERAGNATYGSNDAKLKYIHRYTPSTRRGRRANDIYFNKARNGAVKSIKDLDFMQELVNKYEGRK